MPLPAPVSFAPARPWSLWPFALVFLLCGAASGAAAGEPLPSMADSTGGRSAAHPFVQVVQAYRRAVAQRDTAALRRLQTRDARVSFEKREGEGRPLDAAGKGPWADWDRFFRARSEALEFVVEERSVHVTNRESNDWYRRVEREPSPYFTVYFLDAQGRVEGKLVQAIPSLESPAARLQDFEAWAEQRYPGLLQELQPEGRIDPSLEKARVWKEKLIEWRAESGLPALRFDAP